MDKKSKNLYITSIVIFAVVTLFGASVLIYTNFIASHTENLAFQTCYMLMMLCGMIGLGSSLKQILGVDSLKARKASLIIQGIVLACCIGWLYIIYFTGRTPDGFSQAATWILAAATVNRLTSIISKRKNS